MEQESARGSDSSETVMIFKSCRVSPLLTDSWLSHRLPQMHRKSVCLCELSQEGGAYGKTPPAWPCRFASHVSPL
ncbi:hypothetical protein EA152_25065, partial [Klebsiella pneumoniae]